MKNIVLASAIGSLLMAAPALSGTRTKISVPWDGKTEVDILVMPGNTARLTLENGSLSISHQGSAIQQIFSGMVKEERLLGNWGLHFDDFNLDGYQDFAIDVGYGYGGVNVFSDIYAFNIETGQFDKILEEVSNIDISHEAKELHTAMKSGPSYISTNYRFDKGKPYKYIDQVVMFNGMDLATVYDKSGKITRKLVVDPADEEMGFIEPKPAIRKVLVKRAWLYSAPDQSSKTRSYLIEGDEVELHDAEGDAYDWFKIRFNGKKTVEGWVKSKDIVEEEQ